MSTAVKSTDRRSEELVLLRQRLLELILKNEARRRLTLDKRAGA